MTLDEYFGNTDAQRFLVVEIERRDPAVERYLLCDQPGYSADGALYTPAIGGSGLPDLQRSIADPFEGAGSTGFGTLTLVTDTVAHTSADYILGDDEVYLVCGNDNAPLLAQEGAEGIGKMVLRRGARVVARLAGPPGRFRHDEAWLLFRGEVARVGGDSDGYTTIELRDMSYRINDANIEIKDAPLALGYCRNVEPILIDGANKIYKVNDGPIKAITAVYSDGVPFPESEYTVDEANGTFRLINPGDTRVTCDVQGMLADGEWIFSTQEICRYLISRCGIDIPQSYIGVDTARIGLYITETTSLGETLTDLMRGCVAYWYVTSNGEFEARAYPIPQQFPPKETETVGVEGILARVEFRDQDRLYSSITYNYRRNWTRYQSRPGSTEYPSLGDFTQRDSLSGVAQLANPDPELIYTQSPELQTYFDDQGPALNAANRILELFGVVRQNASVTLPYSRNRTLGSPIRVSLPGRWMSGVITGITDTFDGAYPTQTVEVTV